MRWNFKLFIVMEEKIILFYNQTYSEYWYFNGEDFPPGYTLAKGIQWVNDADVVVFFCRP